MSSESMPQQSKALTIVKVISVIFIVLSGLGLFNSLINFALFTAIPDMGRLIHDPGMDFFPWFVVKFLPVLLILSFIYCIVLLISAIGMLRLKEWARITFSSTILVGTIFYIVSLTGYMVFFFLFYKKLYSELMPDMGPLFLLTQGFVFIVAIVFIVLLLWIWKRLNRDDVKELFQ